MQSCLTYKSARTALLHRGFTRRQPSLPRPISFAASGLNLEPSREAKESEQEKQPHTDAPVPVEVEKMPVVEDDSTPIAKAVEEEPQPSTSAGGEQEVQEETASSQRARLTAHPIGDVPEEQEDLIASKELVAEMMDDRAFGRRGEQWLAAQILTILTMLFPPIALKGLVDYVATMALAVGLLFMIMAFFELGRNLSPLPEPRKKHQLVVSGIYEYVRHPMYGGLLLAGIGLAVLTRNETRLAVLALLWWVLENKATIEERALSARYPQYADYKAKVKKFFPFIY